MEIAGLWRPYLKSHRTSHRIGGSAEWVVCLPMQESPSGWLHWGQLTHLPGVILHEDEEKGELYFDIYSVQLDQSINYIFCVGHCNLKGQKDDTGLWHPNHILANCKDMLGIKKKQFHANRSFAHDLYRPFPGSSAISKLSPLGIVHPLSSGSRSVSRTVMLSNYFPPPFPYLLLLIDKVTWRGTFHPSCMESDPSIWASRVFNLYARGRKNLNSHFQIW